MNIARGYQAQATTSQGNIFIIGASWSGGQGGKNGELYSPSAGTMTLLSGAPVAPMLTADAQGMPPILPNAALPKKHYRVYKAILTLNY